MFNYAYLIPLVIFMIPIIAILTSHQQKMAKIIHERASIIPDQRQAQELNQLRAEIQELKSLVHQQAIAMDSMLGMRKTEPPSVEAGSGGK